jgi:hypothetical protein
MPHDLYNSTMYFSDLWYCSRDHYEWHCLNARQNALNYKWDVILDRIEKCLSILQANHEMLKYDFEVGYSFSYASRLHDL